MSTPAIYTRPSRLAFVERTQPDIRMRSSLYLRRLRDGVFDYLSDPLPMF